MDYPMLTGQPSIPRSRDLSHLSTLKSLLAWIALTTAWALEGNAQEASDRVLKNQQASGLKAGAYAKNIDPTSMPVWVSGGIVAGKGERIVDSLFARSLVIENTIGSADSNNPRSDFVAICVVDSLGVPGWIVQKAKQIVGEQTPLKPHQILISATHSHSAPAIMGAHGTPAQDDYASQMPFWIADSIIEAYRKRSYARVGYGVSNADRFIHCRRWFMEPGHAGGVLFSGRENNIVAMNPGHDSPYKIRQTAEVDRTIPFLSVQSIDGKPIALLASFCTHYAGAPALSSDYFGVVANELAQALRPDDPSSFVGIMANGTSGDANCIDFARPAKPFNYREVGNYVTQRILSSLPEVVHFDSAALDSRLEYLTAKVRLANDEELKQAKAYVESKLADRLPSNIEENYARETVLLSQMPDTRQVPLQALRVGNLVIAGYPTETYNATGLAVRANSPFQITLNIGLANDLLGYLPPADQFPLGGYTTWRARTSCLEESTEARVVETLSGLVSQLADKPRSPSLDRSQSTVHHDGPNSAVTPDESLKYFELFEHQRIELAAHEPNVIDPVAMRFDDAGNLWVVEMSDYPINQGPAGMGRIRVLKDENLDGLYDQATLFAQGLMFPTGLQLHRDGVLVTVGGRLQLIRDVDGDFVADQSEQWLSGFAEENPQLRVNDPDFGPDGKLYLANGLRSSKIMNPNQPEGSLTIANSDLRWDWVHQTGLPVAGPAQFGMTWDRYGNRYFCSNRNPCDAVLIEPWQSALSPLAGLAPMTAPALPSGEQSTVRPLVSAWTTSNLHGGQFTAACGVLISHSHHLPSASLGNALTCEPTGSLVHRVGLGRVNGRSQSEEPPRPREWLASRDPWFRPVNLEEGPDGAIYIVDMHRAVIEHPDWVPEELKKRVDERWGDNCGRIYRVLSHDAPSVDPLWRELRDKPLSKRASGELIELVNHPRTWVQQTAARLLHERLADASQTDRASIEKELLVRANAWSTQISNKSGLIKVLHLIGATGSSQATKIIENCLADRSHHSHFDPALRGSLWRIANQSHAISESLYQASLDGIQHGSREEAIACAWYLAESANRDPEGLLRRLIDDEKLLDTSVARSVDLADDPYWLMAISAVYRSQLDRFVTEWMDQAAKDLEQKKMIRSFSTLAWSRLIASVANPENSAWVKAREAWAIRANTLLTAGAGDDQTHRRVIIEPLMQLQLAIARGIAKSSDRNWLSAQLPLWQAWASSLTDLRWTSAIQSELAELTAVSLSPEQSRIGAEALRAALEQSQDPSIKRQLLTAWSHHPEGSTTNPSCGDWILNRFDAETPAMRAAMFQALRIRPERLTRFLDAIESGNLSGKGLDASQIQSLAQVPGDLQPRISKWLSGHFASDRQKVIERYSSCLELPTNMERGKQLFAQHCAACHKVDNIGVAIGPDISDSRTQTSAQLLVSILDPNRVIDKNYFRITVQMNDGTLHDGIVVEESAEHVTIKNQQTTGLVLTRREIEAIKPSGLSLMPEGIEAQLDAQAMADLVGYLKNWRYVGGQSPTLQQTR
ncbi:MAG: c-type cytochrome [Planctomycetaceae bacterium]|jgi:putative membrane-bound dehydrogenase-like protein|nr:c-type cytochrome [Planctomycetaceae bacterium]